MSTYLQWTQLANSSAINGRGECQAALDTGRGFLTWAGSGTCGDLDSTVDKFDGSSWTSLGTPPPWLLTPIHYRSQLAMTYDVANSISVMFGGYQTDAGDCSTPLCDANYFCLSDETITYDGTSFTLLSPTHSPGARAGALMSYCPAVGKVVLFGGYNDGDECTCGPAPGCVQTQSPLPYGFTDTWAWDGTDWTQIVTAHAPVALDVLTTMGNNLYGWGRPGVGSWPFDSSHTLWKFDGTDWSVVTTATDPGARFFPGFAYWPTLGKIVMHGGSRYPGPTILSDTYSFDGTDFTLLSDCNAPAREGQTAVPDPTGSSLLFLGGTDGTCFVSIKKQVWSLTEVTGPDVTTGSGSGTCSVATVSGTVNPHGTSTNVYIEYGTTTSYGSTQFVGTFSGSSSTPITQILTGLSPGVTYHFRVIALAGCVEVDGADASFTEGACSSGNPYLHGYIDLSAA